ncbi:conserved hypothetical protein [Flavobacterium sp. 9AF]|uniref:hypothetical protein n=1 Tax=Flavobacterium sp. 9AF TaxID=2653142 RepID=UPI0012F3FD5C|nr:hypothetical protein [Flavobacterium sp. 9AF]VXB46144.1 conserved hypothetical protein [Flavobacterium sp. 9AF]
MFSTKFSTLIFSTVILLGTSIYSICGWGEWDWYESSSNFAPEAYVTDASYKKLFYSINMFYGEESYDDGHTERFNSSVVEDWSIFLKNKMSEEDITYFILNEESLGQLLEIEKDILKGNNLSKWKYALNDAKVKGFFLFMAKARALEEYSAQKPSWDYEASLDKKMPTSFAKNIETIYEKEKDPFLKNRYWFLAMKSYFYSEDPSMCILFFDTSETKQPKNELYYRAIAYTAGAEYKMKNYSKSNYLYSKVFNNCPSLRTVATYCFHPQSNEDFQKALSFTKDNKEKAALWALYGYYADLNTAISKIYEVDPMSPHLDFLVTRAVNIQENDINSYQWNNVESNATALIYSDKLDEDLYRLVDKIAKKGNVQTPHLWNIVLAYFEILKGENAKAESYLQKASKTIPNTELAKNQLRLFQVFNKVSATKKIDNKAEQNILPDVEWLFSFNGSNEYPAVFRIEFLKNWTKGYLSNLYKKQGNAVMAELFLRQDDFYDSKDKLDKMLAFQLKQSFTAWESFAKKLYPITLENIYEYQAIKYAYQENITKAILEFEKTKEAKSTILLGNPFNGKIKDCNDCDHASYQKTKYDKITFVKKMEEMINYVNNGKDVYNNAILLGNAFYNMSYYGNARLFYDNPILNEYGNYIRDKNVEMLLNNNSSKKYYTIALKSAENDEQKAKATYLLTKIERNTFYKSSAFLPDEVDFINFNGFKNLKQNFSHTKYYKEVINECGYFRKVVEN